MSRFPSIAALAALLSTAYAQTPAFTAIPSLSSSSTYTEQTYGLAQTSYSYTYTYTTATTAWAAPTFATPRPLPPCTDAVCPTYGGAVCSDAEGVMYGIICNTRFGGIVIVDSGKMVKEKRAEGEMEVEVEKREVGAEGSVLEQRSYTGTFEGCTGFCDTYNRTYCLGVSYEKGACQAFDAITGNFAGPGFAAVRLS